MGDNGYDLMLSYGRIKLARASQRYVAFIADMVGSRRVAAARRRVLQRQFAGLVAGLNRDYRKEIASRFVITLGDEFQGLLNSAARIPDLIWRLEQDFPQCEFRVGIGLGTLDTELQNTPSTSTDPRCTLPAPQSNMPGKPEFLAGCFVVSGI